MYKLEKYEGNQIDWDKKIIENKGNYRQLFSWGQYKKECGWDVLRYIVESKKNSYHLQILMKSFWTVVFIYVFLIISGKLQNNNGFIALLGHWIKTLLVCIASYIPHSEPHHHQVVSPHQHLDLSMVLHCQVQAVGL